MIKEIDLTGIRNIEHLTNNLPYLKKKVFVKLRSSVVMSLYGLFRGRKSGRYYKYNGRYYRASAPYEAPAIRSGELYRSVGSKLGYNSLEVGVRKEYGKYLEFGTSRMKPRPFMSVAGRRNWNTFERLINIEFERLLNVK